MHFVVLAALLAAGPAQDPVVTEAEFLAALNEDHPAFRVLEEAVGVARAEAVRAGTLDNPEIAIAREAPSGATEQLDVTLAWRLPAPGRRRLEIAAAEQGTAAARATAAADRLAVRLALRQTFAEWAVATARAERLRAQARRLSELAEREKRRAERGESSGLAARRLEVAAVETRSRLALAEAAAVRAGAAARGWRPDLSAEAVPVLPALPEALPADGDLHPRLTALTAELEAARLAREAARRTVLWPELVAGWQRQEAAGASFEGPLLGLSWSLPVADRRQAERGRAAARVEAAGARLELARRRLAAQRSYRARPAVVLSVQKQPDANTLELTEAIDATLTRLAPVLPEGVVIEKENFRQADFIDVAIGNVTAALGEGAVLVVIVLVLFLGSLRTTLISALAIPLSLVAGVVLISIFGAGIDTMTLGGLTIAIGLLVDDAIIAVENVFRRLKGEPPGGRSVREVVASATSEVVSPILFATLIILLVFVPVFFLPGLEGRLLRPLGFAFGRAGSGAADPRGRGAGQRDPEPDGPGDPGGPVVVHLSEPRGGAGALRG